MLNRRYLLPLLLLVLFSLLLVACATPEGTAAGPDDPAGIRAAVPLPADEQAETADTALPATDSQPPVAGNQESAVPSAAATPAAARGAMGLHQSEPIVEPGNSLSEQEASLLIYMREEEKLAGDVYALLHETWGLPIFDNIAASERQHEASALSLMEAYGLADPAAALPAGQYSNADLQALYDQLVAQGTLSPADALLVGGMIEEVDVADLGEALAQSTQQPLVQLLTNLRLGSANHLLAFSTNYERQTGTAYTPQHLSAAAFDAVLADAAAGQGGYGNGQGGNGGNGQGQGQNGQRGNGRGAGGTGRGGGNGFRGGQG